MRVQKTYKAVGRCVAERSSPHSSSVRDDGGAQWATHLRRCTGTRLYDSRQRKLEVDESMDGGGRTETSGRDVSRRLRLLVRYAGSEQDLAHTTSSCAYYHRPDATNTFHEDECASEHEDPACNAKES